MGGSAAKGFEVPIWLLLPAAGVAFVGLAILALRNMPVALSLIVATSVLLNVEIPTGTYSPVNSTIVLVGLFAGVWVVRMITLDRKVELEPPAIAVPLLAFISVAALSWLAGYAIPGTRLTLPNNAIQVQAGQFGMFALSIAAFFLAANHRLSEKVLRRWTWIIVILGVLAVAADVFGVWSGRFSAIRGAMLMWPFVLLMGQLLFNPNLGKRTQIIGWGILGLWAYWTFLTPAFAFKGGWVPAFLAMGILFTIRSPKLSILLGVLILVALLISGTFGQIVADEIAMGSRYRPLIWRDIIKLTGDHWLLGLGPANYMYAWPSLGVDAVSLQEARLLHPNLALFWSSYIVVSSHNLFVDLYAQTGILGLGVFVWFVVAALIYAWRVADRLRPSFSRAHAYAVFSGFGALVFGSFLFADWLIPFVYNITIGGFRHSVYTWLLLGTLVSLGNSVDDV